MEIPDDVKMFLRAVLVTSPGMCQSKVTKEYYDTMDERLEYSKLGYRNIYDFLVALEGDVTRMEFSPKHGDNLVFAVLDKTKYASKHAQKYANKSNTGQQRKSPEEILQWRKQKGILSTPVVGNRRGNFNTNQNQNQRRAFKPAPKGLVPTFSKFFSEEVKKPSNSAQITSTAQTVLEKGSQNQTQDIRNVSQNQTQDIRNVSPTSQASMPSSASKTRPATSGVKPESGATINEWALLRELLPENNDRFTLTVTLIGLNRKTENREIFSHFGAYNPLQHSIIVGKDSALASFPSFFCAYRAWREKHQSIMNGKRIAVEPSNGNLRNITTKIYNVMVIGLPGNVVMSTFVTKFARFSGLVSIDAKPREGCAIIGFFKEESAVRACSEDIKITIKGVTSKLSVQMLDEKPASFSDRDTMPLKDEASKENSETIVKGDSFNTIQTPTSKPEEKPSKDEVVELDEFKDRVCGFSISYQQWYQMFEITRRKKPKMIKDLNDEIKFLVVHQTGPVRFWGWLMQDNNKNIIKLGEIEKSIINAVAKVQPPTTLPNVGHRGVALFKDGENETWYRCYVLSSHPDKDSIEVFFCDYGNTELISRELFRSTYSDIWILDPQAVPLKMHGFELKPDVNTPTGFFSLSTTHVLKATVVKTGTYSQPHVVEIKDVAYVSSMKETLDKDIIGSWCISEEEAISCEQKPPDNGVEDGENLARDENIAGDEEMMMDEEVESKPIEVEHPISSLFDYDEQDLVTGILCHAYHPDLLYLRLGDLSRFQTLQPKLDDAFLCAPCQIDKDDVLLLNKDLCQENSNCQRRRVSVLQVLSNFGKAKVLHIDFGLVEWVNLGELYQLVPFLQTEPYQARPACFAGIDCTAREEEAVEYLQGFSDLEVKVNVLHESLSEKISVELFDIKRRISLNKELVDKGIAIRAVTGVHEKEELTPSMLPKGMTEVPNDFCSQNNVSLSPPVNLLVDSNQQALVPENQGVIPRRCLPKDDIPAYSLVSNNYPDVPRLMDIKARDDFNNVASEDRLCGSFQEQCAIDKNTNDDINTNNSVGNVNGQQQDELNKMQSNCNPGIDSGVEKPTFSHFFQELIHNENNGISFPPPDIIPSDNNTNNIDGNINPRMVQIDGEIFNFDTNSPLNPNLVNRMRYKWGAERKKILSLQERLQKLCNMSTDELKVYYTDLRKQKLRFHVYKKMSQKQSGELQVAHDAVIKETNQMLSSI